MSEDEKLAEQKELLITHYVQNGYLKSKEAIRAFRMVPREKFIGPNPKHFAYSDRPLPIFSSQTISAPHMVAMMVSQDCIDLRLGHICLDVGAGSGYHAAVIAEIIAPSNVDKSQWGHVYAIERIKRLVDFANENLKEAGYDNRVTVFHGDGTAGYPEKAPYDRISVAAAAPDIPPPLIKQLKKGGKLVIPVGGKHFYQELKIVEKIDDKTTTIRTLCGVAFVPLIGEFGY